MGFRKKWKQAWKGAERAATAYTTGGYSEAVTTEELNAAVGGAAVDYQNQLDAAATEEERAKIREDYEKRRKAKKTQTILTSGSGASGTPATSNATLLGG